MDVDELMQQIHESVDRMWKEEIERTVTGGARIDIKRSHDEDGIRVIDEFKLISYGPDVHGMGTIESVDEELSGRRDDSGEQPDNQEK